MVKKTFKEENDNIELFIKDLFKILKNPGNWIDDSTLEFKTPKDKAGKLYLGEHQVSIEGRGLINLMNEFVKKMKRLKANVLDDKKQKTLKLLTDVLEKRETYGNANTNFKILKQIENNFRDIGIGAVETNSEIKQSNCLKPVPTLCIQCNVHSDISKAMDNGQEERLKNSLFDTYKEKNMRTKDIFRIDFIDNELETLSSEKTKEIKIGENVIGKYYIERNLIHLNMNPFIILNITALSTTIPEPVKDLITALKLLKITTVKSENFEKKLFITAFLKKSKDRLTRVDTDLEKSVSRLQEYNDECRRIYEEIAQLKSEKLYIQDNIDSAGKGLFEEIDKAKKLSFVKNIELKIDTIEITYIPTSIKYKNYKSNTNSKRFKERTCYLGEVTAIINPSTFKFKSDIGAVDGYALPHVSGNPGNPCFGEGAGKTKIMEALAGNRFVDLTTLLWFYIKTYNEPGSPSKYQWQHYNYCLQKGFPVWDETGNRITINDRDRIKSGEQPHLSKLSRWEDNIKKYRNVKYV